MKENSDIRCPAPTPGRAGPSVAAALLKLEPSRDFGLLTEEKFQAQKAKLLRWLYRLGHVPRQAVCGAERDVMASTPVPTEASVYATVGWVDWCNNESLHGNLGIMSPVEFEPAHYADSTESRNPP